MNSEKNQRKFFQEALKQARLAADENEVPIGAVLVQNGKIVARARNQTEKLGTFTAHAEILVIQKASRKLKTKYLKDCELFLTLEPCMMCLFAARLARVKAVYFLTKSEKFGSHGPAYQKTAAFECELDLGETSKMILSFFFKKKRHK